MNKILLLIAGTLLILMTTTSPALIRTMFNTGAPVAIFLWLTPIFLLFAMYFYYRNYPSATFQDAGIINTQDKMVDTEKKDDLEQAIEANDIRAEGD